MAEYNKITHIMEKSAKIGRNALIVIIILLIILIIAFFVLKKDSKELSSNLNQPLSNDASITPGQTDSDEAASPLATPEDDFSVLDETLETLR